MISPVPSATQLEGEGSARATAPGSRRHADASAVITEVYTRFATTRKQDRVTAWLNLQHDLATNAGVLIPTATSLKDMNASLADIEAMLKGQQGDAGKSPAEYLAEWLGGTTEGKPQ